MVKMRRVAAGAMAVAMCISLVCPTGTEAAKKPKLSKKKVTVGVKKSVKVKVKNVKAKKIKKLTVKSNKKKIATVKKNGKTAFTITGKKAGSAVITAKVLQKGKKKPASFKVKVKVTEKQENGVGDVTAAPVVTPNVTASQAPATTPVVTPSTGATTMPPATEAPARNPQSIIEAYQDVIPRMGNIMSYYNGQMSEEETMTFVKKHFNSITLENEMKPDSILKSKATKITKEEALELGYTIPDSYVEENVPKLNFDNIDKALEAAYSNGLKMRGHTLQWHSQTPQWWFTEDYSGSNLVDEATMNARIEFYVESVMSHVMEKEKELTGEAGSIVYAWDVTNEYIHRSRWGKTWATVYDDDDFEPTFVKKAYEVAYATLEKYNAEDKVVLVFNDYDTYFNVDDIIALVNYINDGEVDKDGNPVNICGAIGMQSHLDVDRPTLDEYGKALDAFIATGLEVHITELDVTINWDHTDTYDYEDEGQTDEDQAAFVKDLMELIITKQKTRDMTVNPKGITSLTIWGLCDAASWRGKSQPTLFGDSIQDPKPSYTEFIKATDLWYN